MILHQFCSPPPGGRPTWETQVHVWLAELEQPGRLVQRLAGVLSEAERLHAQRLYFEHDRRHFVVARGVLRMILGWYLALPPERLQLLAGPHGKPFLAETLGGERLRFNVSHSQGLALYAVTENRAIGVDIERMRPLEGMDAIARRFFSAGERAIFERLPAALKQEAFYNCWTRKEAYMKATGEGVSQPLEACEVSLVPGEPARLLSVAGKPAEASRWRLEALQPPAGYVAALAVEGSGWQFACWRWEERFTAQ